MQEEPAECRICRCEGDEERPLFYPCACTGSIKWCHESCLIEWIKVSRTREICETCGTQLVFKSVYSESTPTTLPAIELTWLGLKRVAKELPYYVRGCIVFTVWLIMVPVWAALAFNYVRSIEFEIEGEPARSWYEWFSTHPNAITFSTWEVGVWIIVTGFFSLFMLVSVFDFVRGFENGEYATEIELLRQRGQPRVIAAVPENQVVVPQQQRQQGEQQIIVDAPADFPLFNDLDDIDDENDQRDAGDDDNQDNNRNNDAVEDLLGDQLGFDEWVGLRGPWCLIFNNAMCLCICVLMFLVTFYVIPESLGRGVFREASRVGRPVYEIIQPLSQSFKTIIPPSIVSSLQPPSNQCPNRKKLFFINENTMCNIQAVEQNIARFQNYKLEAEAVVLGLIVTMMFIQVQFQACVWGWKYIVSRVLGPQFMRGLPYHIWRSVLKTTRTIVRVQKVVCLLLFKMVAFPIVLGVLIDKALQPALSLSENDRIFFMSNHPHLTGLCLWVAGITHTLLVTMNVILIRDILHHDVLDGIIRMRDPHGNQFLPLLVDPLLLQTKRIIVTCFIYTMIVFLFVSAPVYALKSLNLLPIPVTVRFVSVGLQLPVELTLFHMWMLHVLEKSKSTMVSAQQYFFRVGCEKLGLTEYLLPIPINAQEHAEAVRRAQIQAGQLHWLDSAPRVSVTLFAPRVQPRFAWLRTFVLATFAWMTWLVFTFVALTLPYFVGVAAVSCLPAVPAWTKTDVRLYFVGWMLLRSFKLYGPRLLFQFQRLILFVSRDVKDAVGFVLSALVLAFACPAIFGFLVFLETAFTDADFPAENYRSNLHHPELEDSSFSIFAHFLSDFFRKIPLSRAWLAGFPFALLFSNKTYVGRAFWKSVFDNRLVKAGKLALKVLSFAMASGLMGVFLGLEFWGRSGITSSPISTIRVSVFFVVMAALVPSYLMKYYDVIQTSCRRFHDTLKDEKYLMGRRLRNFDARV